MDNNGTVPLVKYAVLHLSKIVYGQWQIPPITYDQMVKEFGSKGSGVVQFEKPFGVAFDDSHHLYVSDSINNVVQEFDIDSNYLSSFGSKGSETGQLDQPRRLEVYSGKVYVCSFSIVSQCFNPVIFDKS